MLAPPRPPEHDDREALIREARARQRKRRLGVAALVAVLAGAALGIYAGLGGNSAKLQDRSGPRPLPAAFPSRCRSDDLRLAARFGGAGTGTVRDTFTFTNVSQTRCTLSGWPSVRVVLHGGPSAAARPIRRGMDGEHLPHPLVVLRQGGTASFVVLSSDGVGLGHACPGGHDVLVAPPGERAPLRVAYALSYCGRDSVRVAPLVAGRVVRHYF